MPKGKIYNSNYISNKEFFSLDTIDLNDSKGGFSFLKENENTWLDYFGFNKMKDINKQNSLYQNSVEIFTKNEKEIDVNYNIILKLDEIRNNSEYGQVKINLTFYKSPVNEIWKNKYFNHYYEKCWKQYKFSSSYKARYATKFKKVFIKSLENILCYMGFNFTMKWENLYRIISEIYGQNQKN